jgi:hypothetical protein
MDALKSKFFSKQGERVTRQMVPAVNAHAALASPLAVFHVRLRTEAMINLPFHLQLTLRATERLVRHPASPLRLRLGVSQSQCVAHASVQ